MYRRPKWVDSRISEAKFERLMEIASSECDACLAFGGPSDHFERAVLAAAAVMLPAKRTPKPRTAEQEPKHGV